MPDSPEWRSEGTVFAHNRLGSVVMIKYLEGAIFGSKQLAEAHGVVLCKKWIDDKIAE